MNDCASCARSHWPGGVPAGLLLLGIVVGTASMTRAAEFPGPSPGPASASLEHDRLTLHNAVLSATWNLAGSRPALVEVVDRISDNKPVRAASELFAILLDDGRQFRASDMRRKGAVALQRLKPRPKAVRRSLRLGGWQAAARFASADGRTNVAWRAVLRDGANTIQQRITVSIAEGTLPVKQIALLDVASPGARVIGSVDGSPAVAGNLFFACEHPMAKSEVRQGRIVCILPRYRPVESGAPLTVASVIGVAPPGQLRRAFLHYIERERARPYRPFCYYISWFDIAYSDRKMNERQCIEVIETFGRELTRKRGVKLDAFVFDDGWDDNRTLWRFHEGFPRGFAPLQTAAARHGAVLGVWLSPWGGYAQAKRERLEYGRTQGFETNERGFALGGPKYYARFRDACTQMIRKYGVRYLKFDGLGKGSLVDGPGEEYGPDTEAMLRLLADLRTIEPGLFINATVGTWPSPYWLWYSDVVWRGGRDIGYLGAGTTRQQWVTYRDSLGHRIQKARGPLFPLNSLKFQSVMHGQLGIATKLSEDPRDLLDDIRMAAASGTQLQEFFITSKMMTPELWDGVAGAVRWSRANADVLVDSHWIGGDPAKGEVYGFASWSPRKGIFALRNPADQPARFAVDLKTIFELPEGAPRRYVLHHAWNSPTGRPGKTLEAGQPHEFTLAPFEVLVLEAVPARD